MSTPQPNYFHAKDKIVSPKTQEHYPDAARLVETCWTLHRNTTPNTGPDKTYNFWIYPTRRTPDVSRAYAVLNELIDQIPGAILYIEEICRKFTLKFPGFAAQRPFSDSVIVRLWPIDNWRRLLLRELEKACEQALSPTFGSTAGGGWGGGGGGGPNHAITSIVHGGKTGGKG